MSTPTQKHTRSSKRIRRAALEKDNMQLVICPKCKQAVRKHTACSFCGSYKGKESIKIRIPKKLRNKKVKEDKK